MPSRRLQAKGEMCTLQTGKLCYNAIDINNYILVPHVQNCKRTQISRLSWSFIAVSSYHWSYSQLCNSWHRISQQSYETYVYSGIELELAWSKVSTKVCGFTFRSISPHLTSKRIKKILTQKQQYNAKYLSWFKDKNAFRKSKKSIYFSRFQLYAWGNVHTCTLSSW